MTRTTRSQLAGGLAGLLVGVLVIGVLVFIISIRATQQTNTVKADKRDEALELVKDCVTPGGVCYERGQAQTAKAVGDIALSNARAAAAAAYCARQPENGTYALILECTTRRVAEATKQGMRAK